MKVEEGESVVLEKKEGGGAYGGPRARRMRFKGDDVDARAAPRKTETPSRKPAAEVPRVLIVARRMVRKDKYVDYVGEYHLNLVVQFGAMPVIVPRQKGVVNMLDAFEPFHGLLIVEGEDVHPALYGDDFSSLGTESCEQVMAKYSSDMSVDHEKDAIELELVQRCVRRGAPILGICRGSQMVNVAFGGDLYLDVSTELCSNVLHYSTDNYDGHRHLIHIEPNTPLHRWFGASELHVNSYHHQGVKRLARRFQPMAHADDGLVEAYFDPNFYDPAAGKFIVGLQFHPERMQDAKAALADEKPIFEHAGCPTVYEEFIGAVHAFASDADAAERSAVDALVRQLTSASVSSPRSAGASHDTSPRGHAATRRMSSSLSTSNMAHTATASTTADAAATAMNRHLSPSALSEALPNTRWMSNQPWRAHMTVHGGSMALSLLNEGIWPNRVVDHEFEVDADAVRIEDGLFVMSLPESVDPQDSSVDSSTHDPLRGSTDSGDYSSMAVGC